MKKYEICKAFEPSTEHIEKLLEEGWEWKFVVPIVHESRGEGIITSEIHYFQKIK